MDPFTLFANTPYTFLKIKQTVSGNEIDEEYEASGIFKIRDAMEQIQNMEQYAGNSDTSQASLHIKPTESFIAALNGELIGHGIRAAKDGNTPLDYRIERMTEGRDFDNGELEFYRLVLKREDIVEDGDEVLS
jgi:hypothetical protein